MTASSAGAVDLVAGNISFCGQRDVIPPTKQAFITWPQRGMKGVDTHTQGERAWGHEQLSALKGPLCLPNVSPKPDVWAAVDKHLGDIWCFLYIVQSPRSSSLSLFHFHLSSFPSSSASGFYFILFYSPLSLKRSKDTFLNFSVGFRFEGSWYVFTHMLFYFTSGVLVVRRKREKFTVEGWREREREGEKVDKHAEIAGIVT